MFKSLSAFTTSMAMARHAGMMQAVTSQNIANADTPGYRARVVPTFHDTQRSRNNAFELRQSHTRHLEPRQIALRSTVEFTESAEQNGNSVSLETEIINSVSARRQHDRALTIYRTSLGILRSTLSKQ